jgi:hypothetical protein
MKYLSLCLLLSAASLGMAQTPAITNAVASLKQEAQAAADAETKSLTSDLSTKVLALSKSLEGNPSAQKQLESAVNAVLGNKGPAAIEGFHKVASAKLTPDQTRLAKDVYNVGSAYVVKKNFGSLEGSQAEGSQVVTALSKGSAAEALPSLKKIGQNATLTQPQKDIVASVTGRYAPGLQKAGEGLKSLPGLKK